MTNWKNRLQLVPAVYVLFKKHDKALLLERKDTGYRDGELSLPSGHLDGGEPAITAAIREVEEEVGVKLDKTNLNLVHVQHRLAEQGDHERIHLYFEVLRWRGKPINNEPEKCARILWSNINNLPKDLVPEISYFFKDYKKGNLYGHFGF